MIDKVAAYMQKHHMVSEKDHICLGVSGGADSVCLFLLLEKLRHRMKFSISVVHIEHGIRGDASISDMEFVQKLTDRFGIECRTYAYNVEEIARKEKLTVEEAGRKVRYETFYIEEKRLEEMVRSRGGSVKIAVAHHGDDNAETVLFHMCRGSSIEGMTGIHPVRGNIIRPLLCVNRQKIEEFLKMQGQSYCVDETNKDTDYSRNRIRNCVMPQLFEVNAKAVEHINSLAEDMTELADYLRKQVEGELQQYLQKKNEGYFYPVKQLEVYPDIMKMRLLLELMVKVAGSKKDIGRDHARALLHIAEGTVGKSVDLPYDMRGEKTYGGILLYQKSEYCSEMDKGAVTEVNVTGDLSKMPWEVKMQGKKFQCRIIKKDEKCEKFPINKYTKWFDYDIIKNRLCFRNRQQGDFFVSDAKGHRQTLKAYFINEKVPRAERDKAILLADGSHILWIVGYRISEYYKVSENTTKILEVQMMEESHE